MIVGVWQGGEAFAPEAEKVADPWREIGRHDLTPTVVRTRLEDYIAAVL